MVCNLPVRSLTAAAASPRTPSPIEVDTDGRASRQKRPSAVADVLSIGANPTLAIYLSGLFQSFRWTVRRSESCKAAIEFLRSNRAAVAICEEELPDAAWQDALRAINAMTDAPMFVVIGSDKTVLGEVLALGGFDVLTRPLRESEVIWTVASAWHEWMNRFGSRENGGLRCSDA